jgi:hypothetical protein
MRIFLFSGQTPAPPGHQNAVLNRPPGFQACHCDFGTSCCGSTGFGLKNTDWFANVGET